MQRSALLWFVVPILKPAAARADEPTAAELAACNKKKQGDARAS